MPIQLRCFSTSVVRRLDDRWYSRYSRWTAGLHSDGRRRTWWGRIAGCRSRTRWVIHAAEEDLGELESALKRDDSQRMASMRTDNRCDDRSRSRQPLSTIAWRDWVQQLDDRTGARAGATGNQRTRTVREATWTSRSAASIPLLTPNVTGSGLFWNP